MARLVRNLVLAAGGTLMVATALGATPGHDYVRVDVGAEGIDIGVRPPTIGISGSGGDCQFATYTLGSFQAGYENSSVYLYDGIGISNPGTCTSFAANYQYTNCGFTGTSAFRCTMDLDPVSDGNSEYGFCRFMLMYEANYDGDADTATWDDRVLLTAHAQQVYGPWLRYLPAAAGYPSTGDIRVKNTSKHEGESAANIRSFTSVPALHYDPDDSLWRMWFVSEDAGGHSVRYTESDDDGQSWGIGGGSGATIDCWNGAAFDTTACVDIDWTGTPPPNGRPPWTTGTRTSWIPRPCGATLTGRPARSLG